MKITGHDLRQMATFLAVGGSGMALNLALAWALTTYVFGARGYFYGYLAGTALNLIYLFVLHSIRTFKTTRDHGKRLVLFALYHLCMTALQAAIVRILTPVIGVQHYLFVIAGVILVFSFGTFFIFKHLLFAQGALAAPAFLRNPHENP